MISLRVKDKSIKIAQKMKLGFHYHIPCVLQDGVRLGLPYHLGCFVDSLADNVDELYCFFHITEKYEEIDYFTHNTNITVISLGKMAHVSQRVLFPKKFFTKNVKLKLQECDVMIIRGPSPLLHLFPRHFPSSKIFYYLVGSFDITYKYLNFALPKAIVVKALLSYLDRRTTKVIRNSNLIVNSRALFNKYKNSTNKIVELRSTTLKNEWFFKRNEVCINAPINLLFVGRLEYSKGLYDLIDGLKILIENNIDVKLTIIGKEDNIKNEFISRLISYATKQRLLNKISFTGHLSAGELLNYYRTVDILIMPSHAEGFPRVIWEAMANQVPVITTNVGSIPYYLEHKKDALIIRSHAPQEIANAVMNLMNNPELVNTITTNAYEKVKDFTVDRQVKKLMEIIQS